MHALLLTLVAAVGADGYVSDQPCAACQGAHAGDGYEYYGGHMGLGAKIQQARIAHPPCGGWWGMMPQTAYDPPFGCYAATRHNHRYPAFHGTYYRYAYNYRNYFDYPWHAEMHEPTSQFSYNVEESVPTRVPLPAHASNGPMSRRMVQASQVSTK